MLTPISGLEDSSLPSVAVAGAQGTAGELSRERRQEFENILAHGLPRLRRIAMRWLHNPEDAEDAVQEALLSAFRHIARFDGRSQMSTWLTAIVINAARMQIRRCSRGKMLSLDQSLEPGQSTIAEMLADSRPTPEQNLEKRQSRALVIKLICSLPPSQRAALRLRRRDDFSIRTAAQTLGVPEGTLKAWLARGRAELRERFRKATRAPKSRTAALDSEARRTTTSAGRRLDRAPLPAAIFGHQVVGEQGGHEVWVSA